MSERYIVVALDPRTGTHRLAGPVQVQDEDTLRFTVPANCIPGMAQMLAPKHPEIAMALTVASKEEPLQPTGPAKPRPTLRSV